MKDYPSIPQSIGQKFREMPHAFVFDKLDGSSMRAEWTLKQGWWKFGKRQGLVDDSNQALTEAPGLFLQQMGEPLERVAVEHKWRHLIVFFEFWGDQSFAGRHIDGDVRHLTLFDADRDKKGIISPKEFRELFEGKVDTARFLGNYNWTRGFVERIYQGDLEGITFEGVVGKVGERHKLIRAKAKTQAWLNKVKELYGEDAEKIINS